MIWSKARFQHSFEIFPRVLKEVAPLLFPLSLLLWSMEFYVSWLNKSRFEDPYGSAMSTMIIIGLLGIILQCFISVISTLYIARSAQRQAKNGAGPHPFEFLKKHFHQSLIEYVRGFISVGIYSIFLILPGIFRWIQLQFVCLVSAFDPNYHLGKRDALKESSRLVRGAWLPLFLLIVFNIFFPTLLEESAKDANTGLILKIIFYGISWIINLYFAIYFSLTFFARHSFKLEKA